MKKHLITEEDLKVFEANMKRIKSSPDGVNEAHQRGAGGGEALTERPARGTAVKSSIRTSQATNGKYAPYRNKLEHSFALTLVAEKHAGLIRGWAYESQTLKLAHGKYHRPDFLIWHLDGAIEIAQTKGYHKNLRASMTGLAWAAQKNPWYRFTIKRFKNGWHSEEV
jgi:hypothetical protein